MGGGGGRRGSSIMVLGKLLGVMMLGSGIGGAGFLWWLEIEGDQQDSYQTVHTDRKECRRTLFRI